MRSLLLYNPLAGRYREGRTALVRQISTHLSDLGYDPQVAATTHRGSAAQQVRDAIHAGAEIVFACGGDGTVHDVLQGLAGTSAALAIIPFGSGNALASELAILPDPISAAQQLARARNLEVHVGRCTAGNQSHAFLSMAGAGPDGALMYRMLTVDRSRWGRWAYAVHALRLLFRSKFQPFAVRYRLSGVGLSGDGEWRETRAVSAIAMRISSLGGIFPGIARGASLLAPTMRLALVNRPACVGLPLWFAMNWLGLERWNPLLEVAHVCEFSCESSAAGTHAQVDGEWIGRLPIHVKLTSETVRLLVPG